MSRDTGCLGYSRSGCWLAVRRSQNLEGMDAPRVSAARAATATTAVASAAVANPRDGLDASVISSQMRCVLVSRVCAEACLNATIARGAVPSGGLLGTERAHDVPERARELIKYYCAQGKADWHQLTFAAAMQQRRLGWDAPAGHAE